MHFGWNIEGVTRASGLVPLAGELGFKGLDHVANLFADNSAAKSFFSRRGLEKVRHIEIRDVWLRKEGSDGKVEIYKTPGESEPADFMSKIYTVGELRERLGHINLTMDGGRIGESGSGAWLGATEVFSTSPIKNTASERNDQALWSMFK